MCLGKRQPSEDSLDLNDKLDLASMDDQWNLLPEKDGALNTAELGIRYKF